MSDSYLDHIPSAEREKIRKRMRSPEAYEKLREKVKGPEDLEREMDRNEKMAELSFALESEPKTHDALKKSVENDLASLGIEAVLEQAPSPEAKNNLERGKFKLTVSAHPSTHQDHLMVVSEGNVQEKIPVKTSFSEKYVTSLLQNKK
jgi:hypothetical protein